MSDRSVRGFVLARRPFREHDLRAELLLEDGDRADVLAPSGQRSRQRYAGGLTPMAIHRFGITASAKGQRLDDARIERAWPALHADLTRQTVALAAASFVRDSAGATPGDGTLFLLLGELHEHVGVDVDVARTPARLVRFVAEVLHHGGHAPVLDRCVRCDAPAPDLSAVTLDPAHGGIVCRSCGGGSYRLNARDRAALRAVIAGDTEAYTPGMLTVMARVIGTIAPDGAAHLERAEAMVNRRAT